MIYTIDKNKLFYWGILFSSLDSFPLFSSISTYAPFIAIFLFGSYACTFDFKILRKVQRKYLFLIHFLFFLILYSFYKGCYVYGDLKGAINFFVQIFLTIILLFSFNLYFKDLYAKQGVHYKEVFSDLFIKANLPVLYIGLAEMLLIRFPSVYQKIILLFSHRVSLDRIQLISGEPSWASRLLLALIAFVPLTSFDRIKKIRLYLLILLLLFATGSTLGIICVLLYFAITFLRRRYLKYLIMGLIALCVLSPIAFDLLDEYTQNRIIFLLSLKDNDLVTTAVEAGSGSIIARIGNPLLGVYMGLDNFFLGVGGGYYYFFYDSYLTKYFPEALDIPNIDVVGNSAKNLLSRAFAEFGFLGGAILIFLIIYLFSRIKRLDIRIRGVFVCMLLLTINFDSLFHIYPLLIYVFLLNVKRDYGA